MDIWTGYYAQMKKYRKSGMIPVSIAFATPIWYEGETCFELAPTYQILKGYKSGEVSKEEYTKKYLELLERVKWGKVMKKLRAISQKYDGADLVLCCYEKPDEFCHRHILAEYLTDIGVDVQEWIVK